ncbi:MAG: hypothetical protein GY782_05955 [Gammaproteobacteria bacterium]|nr:hypothetical protein [Gammaproteobacteria bacterium]
MYITKVKEVLLERFNITLNANDYWRYIKLASPEEKMTIRDVALNMANNTQSLSGGFSLLHDLEEFDAIEALYFRRERDVDGGDYAVENYQRPYISTASTLLRHF